MNSGKSFNAFIDGFNLYKGALQRNPGTKWLDLIKLSKSLMPGAELNKVYFFTAPVKNRYPGDNSNERQHAYWRVLENEGVEIVKGVFRKDIRWERSVTPDLEYFSTPILRNTGGFVARSLKTAFENTKPDFPKIQVQRLGEKGSDVNLAAYLLRAAFLQPEEQSLILTGDSDFSSAIRIARSQGVFIKVVIPGSGQSVESLRSAASAVERISLPSLRAMQYSDPYSLKSGGRIFRPKSWG